MKYTTVVFDLDGTLLNTLEDLKNSVNAALVKYNMPERTIDEVRQFVGNGIGKLMERAVGNETDKEVFEKIFAAFKEHYALHCQDKTAPYEGVLSVIRTLQEKKIKMAIVSNKADFAVKELQKVYFDGYIETAMGETKQIQRKPAPDMVFAALKELDSSVEEAVYVGDSDVDLMTAANSDMDCIGASWGFRGHDFLVEHGAKMIADTPTDILNFIL